MMNLWPAISRLGLFPLGPSLSQAEGCGSLAGTADLQAIGNPPQVAGPHCMKIGSGAEHGVVQTADDMALQGVVLLSCRHKNSRPQHCTEQQAAEVIMSATQTLQQWQQSTGHARCPAKWFCSWTKGVPGRCTDLPEGLHL